MGDAFRQKKSKGNSNLIPVRLSPHQDEILSSWLIRSSLANGSDPEGWAGGIWPDYRLWTRDIDRHLPKNIIVRLCKIVDMSYRDIADMTLEPIIKEITNRSTLNPNTAWPWVIPTGLRSRSRINGLHFCPTCFNGEPIYFKKQWRLSWNVACPDHNVLLQIYCPQCHTAFSPHLVTYRDSDLKRCQKCGLSLQKSPLEIADSSTVMFQEYLNSAALRGGAESAKFPLLKGSVSELFYSVRILLRFFHRVSRCKAVRSVVRGIGADVIEPVVRYTGNSLETAESDERHYLMALVARLSHMKIEDVIALLRDARVTRQMFTKGMYEISPVMDFIIGQLEDNGIKRFRPIRNDHGMKPRSKEEVELMMDGIRRYL